MKLIADSGSTKTDWVLEHEGVVKQRFETVGLNPFFVNADAVSEALEQSFVKGPNLNVDQVWFYGAGCSSSQRNKVVYRGISKVLPLSNIQIFHDLMGASRALFHNEPGIACIMGTGSNTCFYNGTQIVKNVPALGYVLGDEGSGSHLGKELIRSYLYGELPEVVVNHIEQHYHLTKEIIFEKVYSLPQPNRFLASLAPVCSEFQDVPEMKQLVNSVFDQFVGRLLMKYRAYADHPVGVIGSVGVAFKPLIEEKFAEHGFSLGDCIKKPIDGLVKYHLGQ